MFQSADQQKVSCLGMKGPTCAFQGLSQIQQCWEGGGESNVTRPEYSERHDLIRNTCYSCSLIPLCLHSRPKIKRSPLLSQHQGKIRKNPGGESLTISKPSAFQWDPREPTTLSQHVTYLAGEKTMQIYTAVWYFFELSALPFSLPR